jgi:glucose-1-phosphate thymidylyltransferase
VLAVVLAGGYATRLYPVTMYTPKPLLKVKQKHIIDYIMPKLYYIQSIDRIVISINKKFEEKFTRWLETSKMTKELTLNIEDSTSDRDKLGAIRALAIIQKRFRSDAFLIVAGDNLFDDDLRDFLNLFHSKKAPTIALYELKDKHMRGNYSSVELDHEGRITRFVEKSQNQHSSLIGTCIYAIPRKSMNKIDQYLEEGNNPDSPGYFIEWLCKKEPVYGYKLPGQWWDIGTPDSYDSVRRHFESTI